MEFNLWLWFQALLPILVLLYTMSYLKLDSRRAGLFSVLTAVVIALVSYQLTLNQLVISIAKGLSMSIYVILIIIGAVLLYNVVRAVGGFEAIKQYMGALTGDCLLLFLTMSWAFAPFIQGVSGFGVPVAIVGSLLAGMGYNPVLAVSAVLVGHSWSISFGSMGSSFYALKLVTGLEALKLGVIMAGLFFIPIITTGMAVSYMYQGFDSLKKMLKYIIPVGLLMGSVQLLAAYLQFPHLGSFSAGFMGSLVLLYLLKRNGQTSGTAETDKLGVKTALLPYIVLIVSVILLQVPLIKRLFPELEFGFSYPGFTTGLGYSVPAEEMYSAIKLFSHPFIFLLLAGVVGMIVYYLRGFTEKGYLKDILDNTYQQARSSSLTVLLLMIMAMIMNNSGMVYIFARGLTGIGKNLFPVVSPVIGILGAFLTGSNTSSNVLFGSLQTDAAEMLGLSPYLIASAQSLGGSLGSAVAPAKIILGLSTVGLMGDEGEILKKCLSLTLISGIIVGVIVTLLTSYIGAV